MDMDFRERLLKTDIRHLNDNIQILSDELMVLHEFIRTEFEAKYTAFLEERKLQEDADGASNKLKALNQKNVKSGRPVRKRKLRAVGANKESTTFPGEVVPDVLQEGEIVIVSTESTASSSPSPAAEENMIITADSHFNDFGELMTFREADGNGSASTGGNNSTDSGANDSDEPDSDYVEDPKPKKTRKSQAASVGTKKPRKRPGPKQSKLSGKASRSCPVCDVTVDRSELKDHVQSHTSSEAEIKLVCISCCISFPNQRRYDSHKEKYHSKPEDVDDKGTCRFCGKQCGGNYRRIEHERSHTGERPYSCMLCHDMKFTRRDNLNRHMRMVHDKN